MCWRSNCVCVGAQIVRLFVLLFLLPWANQLLQGIPVEGGDVYFRLISLLQGIPVEGGDVCVCAAGNSCLTVSRN